MEAGKPCRHCTSRGCAIYDNRPEEPCRTFRCEWLKNEESFDDEMRPDRCGAILISDRPFKQWDVIRVIPVGVSVPRPSHLWIIVHVIVPVSGLVIVPVAHGLHVRVPDKVPEGVVQNQDVHIAHQDAVAELEATLKYPKLERGDRVVVRAMVLKREARRSVPQATDGEKGSGSARLVPSGRLDFFYRGSPQEFVRPYLWNDLFHVEGGRTKGLHEPLRLVVEAHHEVVAHAAGTRGRRARVMSAGRETGEKTSSWGGGETWSVVLLTLPGHF